VSQITWKEFWQGSVDAIKSIPKEVKTDLYIKDIAKNNVNLKTMEAIAQGGLENYRVDWFAPATTTQLKPQNSVQGNPMGLLFLGIMGIFLMKAILD
jgi:nicotinamide mononucleotide (NMN) deamidase PncC